MSSEEFAQKAKQEGVSKQAYQRRHTSLFEKPSARSSARSSPKGKKRPDHNVTFPVCETPSKMSTRSMGQVALSEHSASPKGKFTPMQKLFAEKRTNPNLKIEERKN